MLLLSVADYLIPPNFTKKPHQTIQESEGQSIKIEARVSGSQPLSITWFKDEQEILQTENYILLFKNNVVQLNIKKAQLADSGVYTCEASNEAGTAEVNVSVLIQG